MKAAIENAAREYLQHHAAYKAAMSEQRKINQKVDSLATELRRSGSGLVSAIKESMPDKTPVLNFVLGKKLITVTYDWNPHISDIEE